MDSRPETITSAIKSLRERAGLSMDGVAKAMEYTGASSYQRYENAALYKGGYLKRDWVARFARAVVGKGTPPVTEAEVWELAGPEFSPRAKPFSTFDPDAPEARLDPDQQLTIGEHTGSTIPSDASPQIDVRAGMGAGGVTIVAQGVPGVGGLTFAAEVVADYWRLPAEVLVTLGVVRRPQNIIILPVQGTSMLPILMEGDFVFVDTRHRTPSPDGIYAIVDEFDSIVIKTLRAADRIEDEDAEPRIDIVSRNPEFPTKRRRASEVNVVGRVVRRFTADFGRDQ